MTNQIRKSTYLEKNDVSRIQERLARLEIRNLPSSIFQREEGYACNIMTESCLACLNTANEDYYIF